MRKSVCLVSLLVAMFVGGPGNAKREVDATYLSLIQLIASPQLHDGEMVKVVGYLRLDFEGTALYLHEIDYQKSIVQNSIWLDFGASPLSADVHRLDGHYVLVEGRFLARHRGHMGIFPGAISPIVSVEPWPTVAMGSGDPRRSTGN